MKKFKVLSLHQPWATLLAHGVKTIETRPKPTSWTIEKGSYLIHATKKVGKHPYENPDIWNALLKVANESMHTEIPTASEVWREEKILEKVFGFTYPNGKREKIYLPTGCIIGAFDVEECGIIVNDMTGIYTIQHNDRSNIIYVPKDQLPFGNFEKKRYAWYGKNFRRCEPFPYKGSQGYYANFKGNPEDIKWLK